MSRINQIYHLILKKSSHSTRCIHTSHICSIKTQIKVNQELLNRNKPVQEILSNLDPVDFSTLEKIKTEHQFMLSSGKFVPNHITDADYLELLCLSKSQRAHYYKNLARKEFNKKPKNKENVNSQKDLLVELPNRTFSKYAAKHTRILETHKTFQAIVLKSQEIVVDCSYEDYMTLQDIKALARQIQFCYELNRSLDESYQLVLVNLSRSSTTHAILSKQFLNPQDSRNRSLDDFSVLVESRHYLERFPRRRLVYLSPQSGNYFQDGEYDHDAVYILGGIVDKGHMVPVSLARARLENIEHRALPIDRCVKWQSGPKSLTLNQVMRALSIARSTNGDWQAAIERSVPARALIAPR